MKRFPHLLAHLALLGLCACAEPEVVVEASLSQEGAGAGEAIAELPVRLLPYDRDAIFDSLQAAYDQPEPAIPPDLLQAQEQMRQAQVAMRAAEARLVAVGDSLRAVPAGSTQFGRLEAEQRRVKLAVDSASARFGLLQSQTRARADSVRQAREEWAARAFADYDQVVAAKLAAVELEEKVDTTDTSGRVVFRAGEGRWWVYARYTLPETELYWNLPVEVAGDSTLVALRPTNAQRRPVF